MNFDTATYSTQAANQLVTGYRDFPRDKRLEEIERMLRFCIISGYADSAAVYTVALVRLTRFGGK